MGKIIPTRSGPSIFSKADIQRRSYCATEVSSKTLRSTHYVHHWITSSARASTDCGIARPSALAVPFLLIEDLPSAPEGISYALLACTCNRPLLLCLSVNNHIAIDLS